MGKLRHAAGQGPHSPPRALALGVLALCLAPAAHAEIRFTPSVGVTETYTDNVTLARDDLARAQFVTELSPSFALTEHTSRVEFAASYQLRGYIFAGGDKGAPVSADGVPNGGTNSTTSNFQASGRAVLIDDLLFLDANGSYGQQPISAFGPQISNNGYAATNRANVKTYQIAPSLRHSFGALATVNLRYTHNSVDAGGAGGLTGVGLGHSVGDALSAGLTSGRAFGKIGWGLQVQRQQLDDGIGTGTSSQSATLSGSYQLTGEWRLTATAGTEKFDYTTTDPAAAAPANAPANSGRSWSTGFVWTPSSRTSLQATFGRRYFGSTYSLAGLHRARYSVWNLSYSEDVTTTRGNFLAQNSVNTSDLINSLFTATISDPVARAQAVAAYIQAAGLPPTILNTTNYFSNRYQLQKQFQASLGLNASRSTLLFSAADVKRTALSSVQADSDLLGGFNSALNDDIDQRTLNATASWQLTPRSTLSAAFTRLRSESGTTGQTDNNKSLRVTMSRQFESKLRASVEVRRVEGTLGQGNASAGTGTYHENAVSATLSLSL